MALLGLLHGSFYPPQERLEILAAAKAVMGRYFQAEVGAPPAAALLSQTTILLV